MNEIEDRKECLELLSKFGDVIDGHHKLPIVIALVGTLSYCGKQIGLSEDELMSVVKVYMSDFYNFSKREGYLQ